MHSYVVWEFDEQNLLTNTFSVLHVTFNLQKNVTNKKNGKFMTIVSHQILILYKIDNYIAIGNGNGDHNGVKAECLESLQDLVIPSRVEGFPVTKFKYQCFRKVPNLLTAFIPNTIKSFDSDAFVHCYKLHTVTFESNSKLESTGIYAFFNTNLSTVTLPITLKTVGMDMFYGCKMLKSVVILNFLSSDASGMFHNCPNDVKILVPSNYPNDTFGRRAVTKILPAFHGIKSMKISCRQKFRQYSISIFVSCLLLA